MRDTDTRRTQDELLDQSAAAQYLGLHPRTLANARWRGNGPPFIRVFGSRIRYRQSDLNAWLAGQTFRSTSEADAAAA